MSDLRITGTDLRVIDPDGRTVMSQEGSGDLLVKGGSFVTPRSIGCVGQDFWPTVSVNLPGKGQE